LKPETTIEEAVSAAGSCRQNQIEWISGNVGQRTDALFFAWYHPGVAVEDDRQNEVL
jgi:hypothetical protein